jgi:GrpB-like predicted nucleotidyltransferase (UPF0157 family)
MAAPREIRIVEYQTRWLQEFDAIARDLRDALGSLALRIDHIGSSSVPGLAAKDIIDIQVTVLQFTPDLEAVFQRAGYLHRTEITHDHRPPMATGSDDDWQKQYYQPPSNARNIHVHVCRVGSGNGHYALLFRDYLRAHPLAAAAYAQANVALAQHGPHDWDLYYDVKDPICDIIMAGAEDWADAAHWRIEHYS